MPNHIGEDRRVLYLAVDLGDARDLQVYGRNVAALLTLTRYAHGIAGTHRRFERWEPIPPTPMVVRTTVASPWVTVLAEASAPAVYGLGALYALHKLLQMVMSWQRHRMDIAERREQLELLRKATQETTMQVVGDLNWVPEPSPSAGGTKPADWAPEPPALASDTAPPRPPRPSTDITASNFNRLAATQPGMLDRFRETTVAAEGFSEIIEAELIHKEDPRAGGAEPPG